MIVNFMCKIYQAMIPREFPRWCYLLMEEMMQVQSLGWEDPLEEGMATHSSVLAWRIPWTEDPGGYGPWDRKSRHD